MAKPYVVTGAGDRAPQGRRMNRRASFFNWLAAIVAAFLAVPVLAQDQSLLHRGPILEQALADYRAGRAERARQGLQYLLRSSPDAADEAYILALHDRIGRENPWMVRGGGAALPSSNIDRVSAHRYFDTALGQFLIPDGGAPRFGTGLWLWGEAGRVWVTAPGRDLSLVLGLGRSIQPEAAQSRSDLRLALAHQRFSRHGHWRIALTGLAGRQDGHLPGQTKVDFNQLSLSISATAYLGPKASLTGDLTLDSTRFLHRDHQSGPNMTLGLGFARALDERTNLAIKARFGRSLPQASHMAHGSVALNLTLERRFGNHLALGGMIELGGSQFDGIFPALSHARRDGHLALGLSISDDRLQVFGQVPALTCTWRSARSNVALYEHQSTDCQLTLAVGF